MDCTVSLELPGLIFLLREVFPYIQTWRFENELDRQKILVQILQHFCDVLKISDESGARLILQNTCVYSLLHLDSGLTLLRLVLSFYECLQFDVTYFFLNNSLVLSNFLSISQFRLHNNCPFILQTFLVNYAIFILSQNRCFGKLIHRRSHAE